MALYAYIYTNSSLHSQMDIIISNKECLQHEWYTENVSQYFINIVHAIVHYKLLS